MKFRSLLEEMEVLDESINDIPPDFKLVNIPPDFEFFGTNMDEIENDLKDLGWDSVESFEDDTGVDARALLGKVWIVTSDERVFVEVSD